jgi:hypothetical protein
VGSVRRFDVCNGDADGLCAVRQWRLHEPGSATLVTGLKRDIALLQRVPPSQADEVLVCDLSLQRNLAALLALLAGGARVHYFDHHVSGPVPQHERLTVHIDTAADLCTSLLMDRYLGGRHRAWALVGAYGDDLVAPADRLARAIGLDDSQRADLRRLGQAINYNAYGEDPTDTRITPADLYAVMSRHADPFSMLAGEAIVDELDARRRSDLNLAQALTPLWEGPQGRLVLLPDAAWSRRVSGCLANELATADPERAQAVLTYRRGGGFGVSVRAPRAAPGGASELCARFGGSGRAAAAGIDTLPPDQLERFITAFSVAHWGTPV